MQLPFHDEAALRRVLTMRDAIEAMRSAFSQLSAGEAVVPVRTGVQGGEALALFMPGWLPAESALGAKVVTVAPGNLARGLPQIHAVILMIDAQTGRPKALLDGTWLTALRTGAASGLATELLARPEAEVLAVVGAGVQARTQIQAVMEVRAIREVRVMSRSPESARELIADFAAMRDAAASPGEGHHGLWQARAAEALWSVSSSVEGLVDGADVVVTASSSSNPVLPDSLDPGTHVNAVGAYTTEMRELPTELVARSRLFVDQRGAALAEAGDLVIPIQEGRIDAGHIAAELGEVVLGLHPGRENADEVTIFKSVGSAAQDLAVATRALKLLSN